MRFISYINGCCCSKKVGQLQGLLELSLEHSINTNGHEYVDLGLPSGTLWATEYIGQTEEHVIGMSFLFANTVGTYYPELPTNIYYDLTNNVYTKYNETDGLTELELSDDAAHVLWSGDWYMPSVNQINELLTFCTQEGEYDAKGWKIRFISIINGNSITLYEPNFLSKNIYTLDDEFLWNQNFILTTYGDSWIGASDRSGTNSVLPVIDGTPNPLGEFTGYESGYTYPDDELDILKYFYKWINRPYEDLIADATTRNDTSTLYALSTTGMYYDSNKEYFYNSVLGDDNGMSNIFSIYGLFTTYEDSDNKPVIELWLNGGGAYYLRYHPSDGYVSIYMYDD